MEIINNQNQENRPLTFEETLSRLEAERRFDPSVIRAADYLVAASMLDEIGEVLHDALENLKKENPRDLYLSFIKDCVKDLKSADKPYQYKFAKQLNDIAIMGLGIWQEDIGLSAAGQDVLRISGEPRWSVIKEHISQTVLGDYFIEEYKVPSDSILWGSDFPLRMSACDASQHRFKLRVPFNKTWATPVVVNNSGGTIKERQGSKSDWKNVVVPRDTREYEDWVVLGPDDYADMDEGDYEWAAKSSMDVGEFFVEETFIFKHRGLTRKPDVHFRDGRIFPQDHLMNCKIQNRHGQLTREAIYRMVSTVKSSNELKILYCGVAKQVELKVYSTLINWYITKIMGKDNWNPTGHIISDSEMMRNLLKMSEFSASTFEKLYISCPIVRRFETASNLNRRTRTQIQNDLDSLNRIYHSRDITARDIINEALKVNVIMFFAGHSKTDELYIPRYEFVPPLDFSADELKGFLNKVLSALRLATFEVDEDHLWGLEEPIRTLIPMPIMIAHDLSKKMGEELSSNFLQRATAEFIKRLNDKRASF